MMTNASYDTLHREIRDCPRDCFHFLAYRTDDYLKS